MIFTRDNESEILRNRLKSYFCIKSYERTEPMAQNLFW